LTVQKETLELLEWSRLCQHLSTFAATKLGAVAARHLIIPSTPAATLNLLAQTKEVYQIEAQLNSGLSFEGIKDIGVSLERAEIGGMLTGEELLDVATTLAGVRRLRRVIDELEDVPVLQELVAELRTYPEIEQNIHHCIDDSGKVTDRASSKLAEIRSKLKIVRERIDRILQQIIQRQGGALQEGVITQRGDRFVIPVKAPQKDQIPGIVHDISSTGATLYIEPNRIVELGNQLRQYQRQEQREIEAILQALTTQIAEVLPDLEQLLVVATTIDLATAKARYSLWLEANPPKFIEQGETITLRQLRHPLLVWQHKHENGAEVIPSNVQIEPKIKVVAITGPNTGGKTVTLKTLGLAALMAKVGLFVPAKEPVELPWFEQILADIGDEQSLQQSLSTFSGHIRRIIRIIEAIGEEKYKPSQSLVLLDEVGAGTDPAEGSALAIALLKYLADNALLTIATTHYGELKALKYQDQRFENASVEFDDHTLSPTYRLLWGIPGRSNALRIAQRLGLSSEIVEKAQELVGGEYEDVNQVIAALEAQRREQENKAKEASKLLAKTEEFYTEVSEKAAFLQEREKELKQNQEREILHAIALAKEEIAQVIRKLQQGPQTAQNAQKATEELNEIAQRELISQKRKKTKPSYLPKVGEKVRLPSFGQTAEVLEINQEEGELILKFGLMKMTVALTEIESLDGQKPEAPVKQKTSPPPTAKTQPSAPKTVISVRTSQNTIDLRGSRIADAEIELERAISKAIESGVLWIIHGKGTGRLRQGIHEFLQRHSLISHFEIASQKEGGSGVTIAYLS